MERKIGEIFNIDNEWYQVVKSNGECCKGCAFYEKGCKAKYADVGSCGTSREDWTQVIFKKLEKVVEPYTDYCPSGRVIYFQRYKCYQKPIIEENIIWHWADDTLIDLEIKQNKENNMEEKKLNLKPFDIQKAREGKPVCTRDGRKARIICFDAKCNLPIIALVTNTGGNESLIRYYSNGNFTNLNETGCDLMMLSEKKEAEENFKDDEKYITTANIQWRDNHDNL